jgi:CheY-like chemotaxis protein
MTFRAASSPAVILVVEDDSGDQLLIQESLQSGSVRKRVYVVEDGAKALEYLFHTGHYVRPAEAPRPDLILLDLNMPRVGGRELLRRLKSDPGLKEIPVVVFTTSDREEDVAFCYAAGANSYVQKPSDLARLQAVLEAVESYWLSVSQRAMSRLWTNPV